MQDPRGASLPTLRPRAIADSPPHIKTFKAAASKLYPGLQAALLKLGLLGEDSGRNLSVSGKQVSINFNSNGARDMTVLFELELVENAVTCAVKLQECRDLGLDIQEMNALARLVEDNAL